ncbi:type IV secretion system protein [Brevundimonas sp. EYE_349]|nr:type IV secretion system protein [Brevundimonas sp. EYE_349]
MSSGIKVLVLAVIIGIGSTLFSQFTAGFGGTAPTIDDAMAIVLAALSLLGLGIFGPGIANGLVSGGPQLGAGAAIGTGLAAGGMVAAGGAAIGAVASGGAALAGGAAAAARGSATLAGGATAAYLAGGASGVASTGASKAGSAIASPFKRAAASMKDSFQAGERAVSGEAAPDSAPDAPSGSSSSASADGPPAWAKRMKRGQQASHGIQAAAHAVKSGDSHGGGSSVNLSESDR